MHRILPIAFFIFAALAPPLCASESSLVIIGVDGMGASGFERADTPHMNELAADGLLTTRARAVFGTSSGANWASLLSGMGPEQHGALDNAWRPGLSPVQPTVSNAIGGFPTIVEMAAKAYPKRPPVALYGWRHFEVLLGDVQIEQRYFPESKQESSDTAAAAVAALSRSPSLLFVQFDAVDSALHKHGHDSPEYIAAIEQVDAMIGRIVAATNARDTLIITADHGGQGNQHGGYSADEYEIPILIRGPTIPAGQRLRAPANIYDVACTALEAMQIARPLHMICRSLLDPALRSSPGAEITHLLPRPNMHLTPGDSEELTLTLDHPDADIEYRQSEGLAMGPWTLYQGSFPIDRPTRIEARARRNNDLSKVYVRNLLTADNGVRAQLFAGRWKTLPDLAALAPFGSYVIADFQIGAVPHPREYFGVRMQAVFAAPVAGSYTFRIKVDDGGAIWVAGQRLAYEPEAKGSRYAQGSIDLKRGPHPLNVYYFQTYGDIAFALDVKTPGGTAFQPIPAHLLYLGPSQQDSSAMNPDVSLHRFFIQGRHSCSKHIAMRVKNAHSVPARTFFKSQ